MPDNNKLKIKYLAFEYTTLKFIERFCELRNLSTVEQFNLANDFGAFKILHFPFIIATANGPKTRQVLFTLFNNFIPDDLGNIEFDIKNYVYSDASKRFKVSGGKLLILKEDITFPKIDIAFFTSEVGNAIIEAIDNSFESLTRNYKELVTYDWLALRYHNQKHTSWRVNFSVNHNSDNRTIPANELIDEQSVFAEGKLQMIS